MPEFHESQVGYTIQKNKDKYYIIPLSLLDVFKEWKGGRSSIYDFSKFEIEDFDYITIYKYTADQY